MSSIIWSSVPLDHTQIGFLNFNVSWTGLAELFSLTCILQVTPHSSELSRNLKTTVLPGSNLQNQKEKEHIIIMYLQLNSFIGLCMCVSVNHRGVSPWWRAASVASCSPPVSSGCHQGTFFWIRWCFDRARPEVECSDSHPDAWTPSKRLFHGLRNQIIEKYSDIFIFIFR